MQGKSVHLSRSRLVLPRIAWTSLIAFALLRPAVSLAQDADEKSQEERIEALEKEIARMNAEQKKEKKEEAKDAEDDSAFTKAAAEQAKEVKGMTPEQLDKFNAGIAAGRVVNYDASWNIGKPDREVIDKGWWGIKGRPSEFRISGWGQFALFHDFQSNAFATAQEFSAGAVTVPTTKRPTTGIDASSSRLLFEFRHVFKGEQKRKNYPGVTHILIEMDLGGGRSATDFIPRVRQFWVQHGNLTFGQAMSTFANAATWPMYFDRGAPGALPLLRRPVLRYAAPLSKRMKDATHVLTPSIEEPNQSIYTANPGADPTITPANTRNKAPDMVLRYDYNPKWGNLMGAVMFRYLLAESTVTPGQEADAWVFAGTLSGYATIPTKNKDRLKFNFLMGNAVPGLTWDTGIASAVSGIPLDATYVDATNSLETTYLWGIWAGWERPWAPKWNSLFMLSYIDVANIAVMSPLTINNAITATGTLMYEPWKNLYLATEYFWGRQKLFNGQSGQDHRLNLVFRYMFNR
jgi:cell division protein FtsB